jgi:hypothetical protein
MKDLKFDNIPAIDDYHGCLPNKEYIYNVFYLNSTFFEFCKVTGSILGGLGVGRLARTTLRVVVYYT